MSAEHFDMELFERLQESKADTEAWRLAIESHVGSSPWSEFIKEFHQYAREQISNDYELPVNENGRTPLAELNQIGMDLVWRETGEGDTSTEDLQPRAAQAVREVFRHLSPERSQKALDAAERHSERVDELQTQLQEHEVKWDVFADDCIQECRKHLSGNSGLTGEQTAAIIKMTVTLANHRDEISRLPLRGPSVPLSTQMEIAEVTLEMSDYKISLPTYSTRKEKQ
jgi:hypothetical protein